MIRSEQHLFRSQTSHIHAKLAAQVEQLLHPVQGESGVLLKMKNAELCFTIRFSLPLLVVSPKSFSTFVTKAIAASLDSPCSTKCSIASGAAGSGNDTGWPV
ncbi:hypothetical protein WJX82_005822 [Trebouxia sp. C0006]